MMLGSMSSYLSSLQQHRKSQYTGNVIGGANEEPFLQKSCSYTQYNLLPPNKTEGELRVKLLQKNNNQHLCPCSSGTELFLMTYLMTKSIPICFQIKLA